MFKRKNKLSIYVYDLYTSGSLTTTKNFRIIIFQYLNSHIFKQHNFAFLLYYTCCCVTKSSQTLWDPMDYSPQAPLSTGFSRQEYWSGLQSPSPGNLPNPGFKPQSPTLQPDSPPTEPPEKLQDSQGISKNKIQTIPAS